MSRTLRVIDSTGANLGVMSRDDALSLAENAGLDLVLTAPKLDPPVAKVMDYGKFLYETSKRERERRQHSGKGQVKEIRFKINIDEGDLMVRLKRTLKFLQEGHRVKITVQFRRWREQIHKGRAVIMLERMKVDTAEVSQVVADIKKETTQATLILAPKST
ncbi:translation initiation factor IF-3 [bacterium]|nr:translation initiation factor IF-3 [bacterium]